MSKPSYEELEERLLKIRQMVDVFLLREETPFRYLDIRDAAEGKLSVEDEMLLKDECKALEAKHRWPAGRVGSLSKKGNSDEN